MDAAVVSFDTLEAAQAARELLLRQGVAREALELRVIDDEAGPVEGNFLVGNGQTNHGGPPGAILSGGEVPYEDNFRDTVHRGSCLLLVGGSGVREVEQARSQLEALGGRLP